MFLPHKNKEIKAAHLFHNLALGQSRHYSRIVRVNGELCYLSGQKTFDRDGKLDFLILVSFNKPEGSQKDYAQRWQIEMCFRSMKSSGFDMEKTHLQKIERIEKLVLLVMVAFVWCYKVGIFLHQNIKQIPINMGERRKVYLNMGWIILWDFS